MKKIVQFLPVCAILLCGCRKKEETSVPPCFLLSELTCETGEVAGLQPSYTIEDIDCHPKNPNQILYVGHRQSPVNLYELRQVDLEQCTDKRILSDSNPITDIDWSSTGDILYSNNGGIFSMSGNGENIRQEDFFFTVVNPTDPMPEKAVWSPDGKRLACYVTNGDGLHVRIKKRGEADVQEIGPLPLGWMVDFSWYAQGLGLYFSPVPDYRVNLLAPETESLQPIGTYAELPDHAVYDATKARLLWTSNFTIQGPSELHTLNLGTGTSALLDNSCSGHLFRKVKLTSDGKRIVAICRYKITVDNSPNVMESIVLLNSDGSGPRILKNPL